MQRNLLRSLSIDVPVAAKLEDALLAIARQNETIDLSYCRLRSEDIARLVAAFAEVEAGSTIHTVVFTSAFTGAQPYVNQDLVNLWNALKTKVKLIKFDHCNLQSKFENGVRAELNDKQAGLSVKVDFNFRDTASHSSMEDITPASSRQESPGLTIPVLPMNNNYSNAETKGENSFTEFNDWRQASAPAAMQSKPTSLTMWQRHSDLSHHQLPASNWGLGNRGVSCPQPIEEEDEISERLSPTCG